MGENHNGNRRASFNQLIAREVKCPINKIEASSLEVATTRIHLICVGWYMMLGRGTQQNPTDRRLHQSNLTLAAEKGRQPFWVDLGRWYISVYNICNRTPSHCQFRRAKGLRGVGGRGGFPPCSTQPPGDVHMRHLETRGDRRKVTCAPTECVRDASCARSLCPSPLPLLTLAVSPYAVPPHARLGLCPLCQLHRNLRLCCPAPRDEEALLNLYHAILPNIGR